MATVKIKDIAKRLNLSPATVSLALNGRPGVNEQTRKNVVSLARELNYSGNIGKNKPLRRKVQKILGNIGFLVYKRYGRVITDSEFFATLISSVELAARTQNYTLLLTYCIGDKEITNTIKFLKNSNLVGLLILGTELTEEDVELFYNSDLPVVILDCDIVGSEIDTVTIHNEDGIWRGMKYLYEQGHREIGYLHSSFSIRNFEQRRLGYENCLEKFCLDRESQKIFLVEPTIEGTCADICELIKQEVKFPSALIADNDLIALGAMKAFVQCGIKVPDDISIVGFDDIPMTSVVEPQLTSVHVPCEVLGDLAIRQLLSRRKNMKDVPRKTSVTTKLNVRSSVKKI
ncbi:MAG: LacI family DNA-binding transcriptional regulator [Selenomonadaceae bacterium]|nr:LacI family DNA-binding transcriptional regulator [Selenomonadaceae bacterium]